MNSLTQETMGLRLAESVPELRKQYDEAAARWEGEELPQHVIFGDVLNPYLTNLLYEDHGRDELHRIFAFLETLAMHEDPYVRQVLAVTVLEGILGHGGVRNWEKAWPMMGPATQAIGAKVYKHFMDDAPLGDY